MSRTLRAVSICAMLATTLSLDARAEIVVEEEEYRDWIHRCEYNTETSELNCFIYTGRVADHEGESLASRIVVILTRTSEPIVYLDVPDRAEPAEGFQLQIDQRPPFAGRFNNCSAGWCQTQALGDIAVELIKQFKAGTEAKVSFVLDGAPGAQINLPLSLLGFTAAHTRLLEVHAELVAAALEQEAEAAAQAEAEAAGDDGGGDAGDDPGDEGSEDAAQDDDASEAAAPGDEPSAGDHPADEPHPAEGDPDAPGTPRLPD